MTTENQHSWYFVCTGNICRSAFAEVYLRRLLQGRADVTSGGTGVNQALSPTSEIKSIAEQHGLSLDHHKPKYIDGEDLKTRDVVLTATVAHRAQVLAESPGLLKRVFTIKEFAQLLPLIDLTEINAEDASGWWRAVARKASELRSRVNTPEADLDILDPFKKDISIYEISTREIMDALDVVMATEKQRIARA